MTLTLDVVRTGADAAPLRRAWRDAREGRAAAVSRPAALLMSAVLATSQRARVLAALRAIAPRLIVVDDEEGLRPYETDALIAHRETPMLAVRLQEMFGAAATPRIAGGKVALRLHLLSPAGRPLACTFT